MTPITSDIVEAYSLCPRKAFLLWRGEQEGVPHEYVRMIEEQEGANRKAYQASVAGAADAPAALGLADLMAGHNMILNALVVADGLEARLDALRRTGESSGSARHRYEPEKVVGTERVRETEVPPINSFLPSDPVSVSARQIDVSGDLRRTKAKLGIRAIRGSFRFGSGHELKRIVRSPSRNLLSRQFVNKHHVEQELRFGAEKNLARRANSNRLYYGTCAGRSCRAAAGCGCG